MCTSNICANTCSFWARRGGDIVCNCSVDRHTAPLIWWRLKYQIRFLCTQAKVNIYIKANFNLSVLTISTCTATRWIAIACITSLNVHLVANDRSNLIRSKKVRNRGDPATLVCKCFPAIWNKRKSWCKESTLIGTSVLNLNQY